MRSISLRLVISLNLLTLVLSACTTSGDSDAGSNSGLDSRPSNLTCLAGDRPSGTLSLTTADAFPNLPAFSSPVLALQAPNSSANWYVLEQAGVVRRFSNNTNVGASSEFANISDRIVSGGELGLLGMAFHPNFALPGEAHNDEVYLSYTRPGPVSHITRYISADAGVSLSVPADPNNEDTVLTQNQPFVNHNGGHIGFKAKGLGENDNLYIGFGDGGDGGDPLAHSQNIDTLLGAVLRLDISTAPYGIPADNPFAANTCGAGGCAEIYAWGFRNPWRWSFDQANGDLWLGDVGQGAWEEVDRVLLGENYGWRCYEGNHAYNLQACAAAATMEFPVAEYRHENGRVSITGGVVYRGSEIPGLVGTYVYGDFNSGEVWGLRYQQGVPVVELLADTGFLISSFAQDSEGEVYVIDYAAGRMHKLVANNNPVLLGGPADQLSQTGCVDPSNPSIAASGLIPYEINIPFWSDGADKQRFMALPNGETLSADADWIFPIGSVLLKHFRLNGELIETRLFMRHNDGGWAGYSYEWNAAQTDANLVGAAGKTKTIAGQEWRYPSANECLSCHTAIAGFSLGLETAQMNRDFTYPDTGRSANQIDTLEHIGLFTDDLESRPKLLATDDPNASLEDKARGYLHSNFAQCHQPGGTTPANIDFRYGASFVEVRVCDLDPDSGDLGIVDAKLLAPGDAARSVISARIRTRDANAMPPLGSSLVDASGADLVDDWINSLQACP